MKTDFSQAIRGAKAGLLYTRQAWGDDYCICSAQHFEKHSGKPASHLFGNAIVFVRMIPPGTYSELYAPIPPDMVTDDWYELPAGTLQFDKQPQKENA